MLQWILVLGAVLQPDGKSLLAENAGGWRALLRRRCLRPAEFPGFLAECREFVRLFIRGRADLL